MFYRWPLFSFVELKSSMQFFFFAPFSIWVIFIVTHLLRRFVLSIFKMKRLTIRSKWMMTKQKFRTDMGTIECEILKCSADVFFVCAIINLIIMIWNMNSFQLSMVEINSAILVLIERRARTRSVFFFASHSYQWWTLCETFNALSEDFMCMQTGLKTFTTRWLIIIIGTREKKL